MSDSVRAIFINADEKTISFLNIEEGMTVQEILDCEYTEGMEINQFGDWLLKDETGAMVDPEEQSYFTYDGFPVAGNALIVGSDQEGEHQQPVMIITEVQKKVEWVSLEKFAELVENIRKQAIEAAMAQLWCVCEDKDGVTHYEDGEHPYLWKHHYRHNGCGRIVQIG